MLDADRIKEALERNAKAVSLRPTVGQGTARTVARLRPGLEVSIEEGPWRLTVGTSEKHGGAGTGPNPGVLGRGALASCLVVGYGFWAARLGIPLESLEVLVEADYDARGELGVSDDVVPGYTEVRYIVTVESSAAEADVQAFLDHADRYSPYLDVFGRATPLRREVRITSTKA